jgi:hypothetical protein
MSRYSDLKEAAVSGAAADLWALNVVELLLVGWVVRVRMWSERLNRSIYTGRWISLGRRLTLGSVPDEM